MKSLYLALALYLLILYPSCKSDATYDDNGKIDFTSVQIEGGLISGLATNDQQVFIFKGIPYAKPPIGNLRWKPPAPVPPWSDTKECVDFAASPIQPHPEPFYMWSEEFLIPENPISEDGLYLNIWTPAKNTAEKRPVVVWVHGGGFVSGGGSVPIYDGEAMSRKGVVFVSINYRLGVFGFLAHPELTSESDFKASGNYGLMDQIAALKWVKNNIEQFGGDPNNVTIAGQSAGSASVVFLGASPLAKGLFQKVIAQSGAGLLSRTPGPEATALKNLQQAEQDGLELARVSGAESLAALRAMSPIDLVEKVGYRGLPIIDGYVLPENVSRIYKEGRQNDFSLLTGWNQDDGIVMGDFQNAQEFRENITAQWGASSEKILSFYPAPDDSIAAISQKYLQRDLVFGAQNYVLANLTSRQDKDVYVYRFSRHVPAGRHKDFGAFHTAEVPYVFNNLAFVDRPFESIDHQLADAMSTYWINFIESGNPNNGQTVDWPKYHQKSQAIINFSDQPQISVIEDSLSLNFLQQQLLVD